MKLSSPPLRLLALAAVIGLALTATLVWAAPGAALLLSPRTGYDPLAANEKAQASTLAYASPTFASAVNAVSESELLLIERHAETKTVMQSGNWPRRADVFVYLYDSDTLLHAIVNLSTRTVDSVETAQNVQLPLTQNETARAFGLLMADATLRASIAAQYQTITGHALTQPETQLIAHAFIYRADAQPGAHPGAAGCGPHRCAQLLLKTHNDIAINLLPIVDLSLDALVSVGPFVGE